MEEEEEEGGRQGNIHVTDTCSYFDARIGITHLRSYIMTVMYYSSHHIIICRIFFVIIEYLSQFTNISTNFKYLSQFTNISPNFETLKLTTGYNPH